MRCGLPAEDCAVIHWAPALSGHREQAGWRASCPVCGAERALEWDVPGKSVRWKTWCAEHDKEALRPVLLGLLPGCLPRRSADRVAIDPGDLIALALGDIPPMSMRLAMLELAGMGTPEALAKLGVRRNHRSRVIAGRTGAPKRVQRPRS
jgi:hypothetical protein